MSVSTIDENEDEEDNDSGQDEGEEIPLTEAGDAFYLTGVTRTTGGTYGGVITGSWFRRAIAIYVVQNRLHENGGSFTRQDFQQHIVDSGVLTDEDTAPRGDTGGSGSAGHRWKHREQGANQKMRSAGDLTTDGDGTYTVVSGNEQRWRDLAEGYVVLPELDDEEDLDEQQTQQVVSDSDIDEEPEVWEDLAESDTEDEQPPAEPMQFPPEVEEIQKQLDNERSEEVEKNEEKEVVKDSDQRGWVYVLYNPAYPTWVVTGKGKDTTRPEAYDTYSPHRDYEVVGMAFVENRTEGEHKLQERIDKEHPEKRGKPSSQPSEWFEITREQAYEILKSLNPESTYRNPPEEE